VKDKRTFKVYTSYRAAYAAAAGRVILQVSSRAYVVGDFDNLGLDQIVIHHPREDGGSDRGGEVTLRHLDRLGNANHALTSKDPMWAPKKRFWTASSPKEEG